MKRLISIVLLILSAQMLAQDIVVPEEEPILKLEDIDTQPDFPGGIDAFYNTFKKHFKAPDVNGLVDKVVLSFVIEKDGSLTDIKIVHDAGFGIGEQCRQIIEGFPKWIPGISNGKNVRTYYLLPIAIITE